ncbi:MAG: RHS repeat protein [Lactobacillus sp.]|nr:RHS repeat protein [Lactobacillus sp.]
MDKASFISIVSSAVIASLPCSGALCVSSVYAEEEGEILYTYDDAGRVVSTTYPDGTVVTYVYDANGNLVETKTQTKAEETQDSSQEEQVSSGENEAEIVIYNSDSQSPVSIATTYNQTVPATDEDEAETNSQDQKKDEATTEGNEDSDTEEHKDIGKWIAVAILGGVGLATGVAVGATLVAPNMKKDGAFFK